ncbi:MAG: glycosyltransferase [Xanthomonadales bacterium]|nr:glycosyltransferase [Xanthomonadales bacterium]
MRVLHIGKYYAPQHGGIERHVQDLAEWQVRHGVDAGVLVHQPAGTWRSARERRNGVDVWRAGCLAAPLYAPLSPTLPWLLSRSLATMPADLLHLHLPNPSCIAVLASARARRLPWIVHWHADVSAEVPSTALRLAYRAYRPFEQAILARSSAIIATSRAYLDASAALADWRAKTRVIALGIGEAPTPDPAPNSPDLWPGNDDEPKLLAVGRLSHYKGFDVLLDALARAPTTRLLLVGDGECALSLRERADRLGISARIVFANRLDDETLTRAYAQADAFVLPSLDRSEAFGLVLLEAMRAGLPAVASGVRGSGIGHVVADGQTGLLVPPGDAPALAAALARIGNDVALRHRLGEAGRRRWREHFTLDRSARAVLDLYLEVLR